MSEHRRSEAFLQTYCREKGARAGISRITAQSFSFSLSELDVVLNFPPLEETSKLA